MRIAVIGAGGVGGGFGGALAKAGADVTFVARGAHLQAMRANGLRVEGGRGETLIAPAQATDDPATIGQVDFVLFCVKLWDVETAGESIRSLIGRTTAVIPLQNGIDAAERLIPILGASAVMGGVAQISATIAEPGVIRQTGDFMRLIFGELEGGHSARGEAFLGLCQKAGFDATHSDQIVTELWLKFILLRPTRR
jgi:2-dehydropantoate 2-reductase